MADQGLVLPPGRFPSAALRFTLPANAQEELQEVVAGNPLNTFGGRPGLKAKTSGSMP